MTPVVLYWLDLRPGIARYAEMCRNSLASLRRYDSLPVRILTPAPIEPGVRATLEAFDATVQVVEETFSPARLGVHPRYSKYSLLDADLRPYELALVLDCDTFVQAPLAPLCSRYAAHDLAARPETGNTADGRERFNALMAWAGVRMVPNPAWRGETYFNTGVYLLRCARAASLAAALRRTILESYPPPFLFDPDLEPTAPIGDSKEKALEAMQEEIQFSEAARAAGLRIGELGPEDHGFLWEGDTPGSAAVFHTGGAQYDRFLASQPALAAPAAAWAP